MLNSRGSRCGDAVSMLGHIHLDTMRASESL
jgi:hypothetical protein